MNRYLIIVIALLLVVAAAVIGYGFFVRSGAPAPTDQINQPPLQNSTVTVSPQSQAVQAAFREEVAKHPSDNTKLYGTYIVGEYAIQEWVGDIMGGQALLKYDRIQGHWVLIDAGGGVWSVESLVGAGVPTSTAQALLVNIPH